MTYKYKFWVRRFIFLLLVGLVGFTLMKVIQNTEDIQENDIAPDFSLSSLDGKMNHLSEYKGNIVILLFWGTWCEPCRQEMPLIEKIYRQYKDTSVKIIAVNIGETELAVMSFAKQKNLTFPIWLDKEKEVTGKYHVNVLPVTFIIDSKGVINKIMKGSCDEIQLKQIIETLLYNRT